MKHDCGSSISLRVLGSTTSTNVVLVVVVVVVVVLTVIRFTIPKTPFIHSFISYPIVIKLRIHIGDNIIHNRTVSDFRVKS